MKKRILLSFLLVAITMTVLYFKLNAKNNTITATQVSPSDTTFLMGVFSDGGDVKYNRLRDSLHLNGWHIYGSWQDLIGVEDNVTTDPSVYFNSVQNYVRQTSDSGLITIMNRPKIWYLANSQRSDYQCEKINKPSDYWFYAYDEHNDSFGEDVQDSGVYVRHCRPYPSEGGNQGWIVKGLRANREQIYRNTYAEALDTTSWYILPRIRIKPSDTATVKNVCRIEVTNFKDSIISIIDLKTSNFKTDTIPYNGRYLEYFYNLPVLQRQIITDGRLFNPNSHDIWTDSCKVDFRVWYYGEVEMWLDRIRVENDRAHDLMSTDTSNINYKTFNYWLNSEIQFAINNPGKIYKYYVDEVEFNTLPAIKYINHKIDSATNHQCGLMVDLNYDLFKLHLPNVFYSSFSAREIRKYMFDDAGLNVLFFGTYPFTGYEPPDCYLPNTLPIGQHERDPLNGILSPATSTPANYESWLQDYMDLHYTFRYLDLLKMANSISYNYTPNIPFIAYTQVHSINYKNSSMQREPTNEEISMLSYLPISYGAKGLMFFSYHGYGRFDCDWWERGLTNPPDNNCPSSSPKRQYTDNFTRIPRYINAYGQPKWNHFKDMTQKIKNWSPLLMSFNSSLTRSYIFRISDERSRLFSDSYFSDIKTYTSTNDTNIVSSTPDVADSTILQVATFTKSEPNTNYFMIINRRCAPFYQYNQDLGGRRYIKIKFNITKLSNFNNWILTDVNTNTRIATFNKNDYLSLGWILPGEANIYKLTPVMVSGGTFVCNEVVSSTFDCDSIVFNNGYDLTIHCGTNIDFKEKGKIVMNGGSFDCNYIPDNPNPVPCVKVQLKGKSGVAWEGLSFEGCTKVNLGNLEISNIGYNNGGGDDPGWQNCAVGLTNCFNFAICDCIFNLTSPANGVNLFYNNFDNDATWGNTFVYNCTFNANSQSPTPVNVLSVASVNTPVKIEKCIFMNNNNEGGSYAIFMNGVTGGVIQSNFIHKFPVGVYALSSSVDLFYNKIYSNKSSAVGLYGLSGSTLNMIPNSNYFTGGYNVITNTGEFSKNIDVENSHFNIDKGRNIFNVSLGYQEENNPLHLYGYFDGIPQEVVPATLNCFQIDTNNTNQTRVNVRWGSFEGEPVSFAFSPFSCNPDQPYDYDVFSEAGFMNDTVYKSNGGTGGGFKNEIKASAQTNSFKSAYDSICISLRKRNYPFVESRSKIIISSYPDSAKSLDLVSKLYLASILLDSAGNKIGPLKSFYETLILNNPGNISLISRVFYYTQKCKVSLKQYQSAMQGFYSIMQQNPYSYEGLVASWDFAATHLLDSLNGHGGGMSNVQLPMYNLQMEELNIEEMENMIERTFDNLDSNKFTKQDRKTITKNVSSTLTSSKQKQIDKVDNLQKKSIQGDVKAKVELKQLKVLNESIKPKKPNTIVQLKRIISDDIKKVFKKEGSEDKVKQNLLPIVYSLSQNYPNPFNPVTKINYELPKDGKVKLVIYDILGREIKTLVNELKQAGRYTIEFNGNNYASGVYFYRIQVEGGKSFTSVKKMVLIK